MYQQACQRLIEPRTIKPSVYCPSAQSAAHQRIRAATDLLETFSCLTFEHSDLKDISHITNDDAVSQKKRDVIDVFREQARA
ncbi:hypothetical protein [Pseudomonas simiae]|uniref:Uncharacterized protein n=1 Tax=Pseudomonas simiae TaxID=321846 RepID=U1TEL0_9PSED|nr:hypothetical protein [Pseudomonas simiae]MBD8741430.1 hypothetical protein [Pseudomonas fluorescens]ERH56614.1 hypothetical protein O204_28150 [Pseudomonas simiae]MBJ2232043.1 hypothetical protein [Pseudomonas simiae]MCF5046710.1 hypothetical protein [Pseudomonas simiae]MCF5185667.1 hypothetical protein [Pseudomonas simiae]